MTSSPLSLSQFARAVGDAVRREPLTQNAWIIAELSDVRIAGGHCYMELIEKDTRGATTAKMRAMIWAGSLPSLRRKFFQATGRDIAAGLKVMVLGSATHHNVYGLSVNITDIDPSYTLGDIERLRREILERLAKEDIIGMNKLQYLPPDAQRIAVISAPGAAGFGDFMKQLDGNQRGFRFYTHLFAAVMQGERTSASVREALDRVEQTIDLWDCVAIVRGGGATSDLNGFDEYELARRVATFPLPVLVGIGHERDRTVLDEIAHTRLKTPTATGAFLVDRLEQAWQLASMLARRAADFAAERLNGDRMRLSHAEASLPMIAASRISEARMRLSRSASLIPHAVSGRIARSLAALDSLPRIMAMAAASRKEAETARLARTADIMTEAVAARTSGAADKLQSLTRLVEALSPVSTLKRGYSITRVNGKAVSDPAALRPGDLVSTTLAGGEFTAKVETIK